MYFEFQVQFIQLCKTLYDLFTESPEEQELYHSIATVATLLLKIGDVGKRFYLRQAGLPSLGSFDDSSPLQLSPQHGASQIEAGASACEETSTPTGASGEPGTAEHSGAEQASTSNESPESEQDNVNQTDNTGGAAPSETSPDVSSRKTQSGSGEEANDKTSPSPSKESGSCDRSPSHLPDSDWSITFEQFLASILTESALVSYFERQVDIQAAIQKYRNRRLIERQNSFMGTPPKE